VAATARTRGRGTLGGLLTRILLTIALAAPLAILFVGARSAASDRNTAANQELLAVDYLRALQPLTSALVAAETDAVAGRAVDPSAMTRATAGMDAADAREGVALGAHDRWQGLRSKIGSLANSGPDVFTGYDEAADLLVALYARLEQTSGLAADPQGDAFGLQRVAAVDLPQVTVAVARYAALAQTSVSANPSVDTLVTLHTQRLAAGPPGRDLVDSVQSAVASTSSVTLSSNILGEFDAMRQALDAVAASPGPADRVTANDAATADALRARVTGAATALSGKVLDALAELITQRRDGARSELTRDTLALAGGLALMALLIVAEVVRFRRRRPRKSTVDDDSGRGSVDAVLTGREPVGAAR
jgi:hypothetical protein